MDKRVHSTSAEIDLYVRETGARQEYAPAARAGQSYGIAAVRVGGTTRRPVAAARPARPAPGC